MNNGNLIISGKINSILKNIEITLSAGIVNQQNTVNYISKFIETPAGKIFGLTISNTVERLAPNLTVINSSSNTINSNYKIQDFTLRNDSLFMTGLNTISVSPFYTVTDPGFNLLYQTPLSTYKNISPRGIALSQNNGVNIISKANSAIPAALSLTSYYQFPLNGNFVSTQDIGVISFSVISKTFNVSSPPTISCNLDVTVKNFTNDTVKNFYLNYEGFLGFCLNVRFHKYYDTIILPNSSVNVKTGSFYVEISQNTPELCVYTTVPNGSNDIQVDNDIFCKPMSIILDLSNVGPPEKTLKVFPNPFDNALNIESDSEIITIEVLNATAESVSKFLVKNKKFSFNKPDFAAGLYLLKIETEKGVQIKKVIKN